MRGFNYITSFLLLCSVLFVAACDSRDEKVEIIPPVEGALLHNGKIPSITPEGAADLKKMISEISFVDQYKEIFASIPAEDRKKFEEHVDFRGKFDVIPRSDHYEVTFPDRTTITAPEDEDFHSIEFHHELTLRVRPTGDPAAFRVEFDAEPKPFYAVLKRDDETEFEFMNITYETGEPFKALWHNDFQIYAQMVGSMRNMKFKLTIPEEYRRDFDNIDEFGFSISNISSNAMLEPDDNNIWSGPYDSSIDKVQIDLPQGVGGVTILEVKTEQMMNKLNPEAYKKFFDSYGDLMNTLYSAELQGGGSDDGLTELLPFMKTYRDLVVDGFESTDVKVTLSDIAVRLNKTPETTYTVKDFALAEASFAGSMSGAQEDSAKIDLSYTLKGIDVGLKQFEDEFGGETPQELVPENFSFGFGVEKLPIKSMLDKSIAIFEEAGGNEAALEGLFMQNTPAFIDLLVKADTQLNVNDTYVGNDVWLLLMNGAGQMNPASPFQVSGETEVRFYGMDYLIQTLDTRMKDEATAPSARTMIQQTLGGLGMMQMMGQQKRDENERDYRGYTITLTPQGAVQMNGTDMSQMMGMMQ